MHPVGSKAAPPRRNGWSGPPGVPRFWQNIAVLFCVAFGICLILNTHPAGDGAWFWYARAVLAGKRLYSGLHLPLQPVYVLETVVALRVLGQGWLLLKLVALLHVVVFCLGLRSISGRLPWSDGAKAILLAAGFLCSTLFLAYRADDYHILADSCEVWSIALLLRMLQQREDTLGSRPCSAVRAAALLGVLSGISIATRVNDGGILLVSVGLLLALYTGRQALRPLAAFVAAATLTVVGLVLCTGDGIPVYISATILHAAASKGGGGHLILYPPKLLWATIINLKHGNILPLWMMAFAGAITGIRALFQRPAPERAENRWRAAVAILSLLLVLLVLLPLRHGMAWYPPTAVAEITCIRLQLVLMLAGIFLFVRMVAGAFGRADWVRAHLPSFLLFIPLGQLLSSSLSSAGAPFGLYGPIGVAILLAPLCFPLPSLPLLRLWFSLCMAVMCVSIVLSKVQIPFGWHSYIEPPMFQHRVWYRHPLYGPMYIDRDQLALFRTICDDVHASGSDEMLSMPLPYANYFCGIAPWHGYVQTFYDTTAPQTVYDLLGELKNSPPEWIVYQRQPYFLKMHEVIFNGGRPLAQRELDAYLESQAESGAWQVVFRKSFGFKAEYLLIRTHPAGQPAASSSQGQGPQRTSAAAKATEGTLRPAYGR